MSDLQSIKDKIRKLLALGHNSGATEEEAATAMSMASALMMKYSIEQSEFDKAEVKAQMNMGRENIQGPFPLWVQHCAVAAETLNTLQAYQRMKDNEIEYIGFVGPEFRREMAKCMFLYLCEQVETMYKKHLELRSKELGRKMTQSERSEFRRTFKWSCSQRLAQRAHAIMAEMRSSDRAAQAATGRNALVVVESTKQMLADIQAWMQADGLHLREGKSHRRSDGSGTVAGRAAGDSIDLQKGIGVQQRAIGHRS